MAIALTTTSSRKILSTKTASAQSFSAKLRKVDIYLDEYADVKRFSGTVLIHQCAAPLAEDMPSFVRSYGLANRQHHVVNGPATKFRIGSITKQFTATAILQLREEGFIDLHVPISKYLPDYPNGDLITIHQLLTHTAGISEYLNPELFPDLMEWLRQSSTLDGLVARFNQLPLKFTPGQRFGYSNSGYVLLTKIIETVSGQTYADYLQSNIFTPLKLDNTGYELPQSVISDLAQGYLCVDDGAYLQSMPIDMSIPQGAGGLYSTVADLVAWTQWLHSEDVASSVLSRAAKKLLIQPIVKIEPESNLFYGYGIVVDTQFNQQRLHHNGSINGFTSSLVHYPEEKLTIVVLSNLETAQPFQMADNLASILFERKE